jgi:hypothetical protein
MDGERLRFDREVSPDFADYIRRSVWTASATDRHSMQQALSWMDRNIKRLADAEQSTNRPEAPDKKTAKQQRSTKDKK